MPLFHNFSSLPFTCPYYTAIIFSDEFCLRIPCQQHSRRTSALTTRVLHYLFYLLTQTTRGNWKAHSGKIFCDKETKARMHLPVHKLHKLVVALFSKGPQY